MFNIFNIFKTENEVIASLEAKIKKLELEIDLLCAVVRHHKDLADKAAPLFGKTFSRSIDTSLEWVKEKVRADELEEELKALKKELKALKEQ